MGLKKFRPITPTLRHTVMVDFSELTRSRPVKSLTEALKKTGGRDNYGHISMRWIGGGIDASWPPGRNTSSIPT